MEGLGATPVGRWPRAPVPPRPVGAFALVVAEPSAQPNGQVGQNALNWAVMRVTEEGGDVQEEEALMLAQHTPLLVSPADTTVLGATMVEPEAVLSDAPVYAPEAAGFLLLLALISPKEPKEPKDK